MRAELLMTLISSCLTLLLILMLLALATPGEAAVAKTKLKQSKTPSLTTEPVTVKANHHHHHHTAERGTSSIIKDEDDNERRVRKRSKWIQQQSTSSTQSSMSNKDGSFIKRIVTEVIAERDAQIAAALFEVAKNQPHLQMMVQTLGELSQSNQRLELSSTRLDETQRRLDSRLGVISEKMTLLESRLSQTERRIEREMTQIHGKMDEVFRNMPDKPTDVMVRGVKQIQDHLNVIEEILLDRSGSPNNNQIRSGGGKNTRHKSNHHGISSSELHKLGNSLSQAIAAVHLDLSRIVRETESNLDHQLNMLATDNGLFSCAISRLMDLLPPSAVGTSVPHRETASAEELLLMPPLLVDVSNGSGVSNSSSRRQLLEGNSIQTVDLSSGAVSIDQLANTNMSTKCVLKCP